MMKAYLVYWTDYDEWGIDKVFDNEEKAKEYILYKPQMTGLNWDYFEKEVE